MAISQLFASTMVKTASVAVLFVAHRVGLQSVVLHHSLALWSTFLWPSTAPSVSHTPCAAYEPRMSYLAVHECTYRMRKSSPNARYASFLYLKQRTNPCRERQIETKVASRRYRQA